MEVVVGPREGWLSPFQPGYAELLGREPLLPFFGRQGHPFHGFKPSRNDGEYQDAGMIFVGVVHAVLTLLFSPA